MGTTVRDKTWGPVCTGRVTAIDANGEWITVSWNTTIGENKLRASDVEVIS